MLRGFSFGNSIGEKKYVLVLSKPSAQRSYLASSNFEEVAEVFYHTAALRQGRHVRSSAKLRVLGMRARQQTYSKSQQSCIIRMGTEEKPLRAAIRKRSNKDGPGKLAGKLNPRTYEWAIRTLTGDYEEAQRYFNRRVGTANPGPPQRHERCVLLAA